MTLALVLAGVSAVGWLLCRERRAYRTSRRARSRFEAELDLHRPLAEIVPFFPPSAPAVRRLPPASVRTPARRARQKLAAGADPCVQERHAASALGYLGPHRKVSLWVEAPLKDKRAPESWHSDRGRAPTPGLEFDGTEDIGRTYGPTT